MVVQWCMNVLPICNGIIRIFILVASVAQVVVHECLHWYCMNVCIGIARCLHWYCMNVCIGIACLPAMLHWYCMVACNAAMGVDMCVLLCVLTIPGVIARLHAMLQRYYGTGCIGRAIFNFNLKKQNILV